MKRTMDGTGRGDGDAWPWPQAAAGGGGGATTRGGGGGASSKPVETIGPTEGALNLIAWQGYTEPNVVKPFEAQTGCQVHVTYGQTSDEMVRLMRTGQLRRRLAPPVTPPTA